MEASIPNFLASSYPLMHLRWLFLLEGLITLIIGILSFFLMPASAVQTKAWFRPNGWFTDRELGIAVNRVLRDDPSKGQIKSYCQYTITVCVPVADSIASIGDMHNRQAITPRRLWNAIRDYDLWPVSLEFYLIKEQLF
jgi:hypothetical protein